MITILTGVNMMLPFIQRLPRLYKRHLGTKTFIIQDSIEGWAEAAHALICSYIDQSYDGIEGVEHYQGYEIKFDYSLIRPKGSKVGRRYLAPGPIGLKNALDKIEELINGYLSTGSGVALPFTTIIAYDCFMHLMNAVLSGGIRRAAASVIFSPEDLEMINCKSEGWEVKNLQRERSNNSVGLIKGIFTKQEFKEVLSLNRSNNDIGFVFLNNIFEIFNPCYEIGFTPLYFKAFSVQKHNELVCRVQASDITVLDEGVSTGIQCCNLVEGDMSKCKNKHDFLEMCKAEAIMGTLQAGYTNFAHIKDCLFETIEISRAESLLGVSFSGLFNNPWVLKEPELLKEGVELILSTNKTIASILEINPTARATCGKPGGDGPVVLGCNTPPEHDKRYFRVMQLNKDTETCKYLVENMPYLLEESTHSENHTDYVVFVPIENEEGTIYKNDLKGVKHLEVIKTLMDYWVSPGTVAIRCIIPGTSHNISNTVIVDPEDYEEVSDYIYNNQNNFRAVSFISSFGDKDYNQCPNTSILTGEEILKKYGEIAMFASGLVVDALHAFDDNLWNACEATIKRDYKLTGNRVTVLIKKDIIRRFKKFAKNYFKNNIQEMIYCLKDVHLYHKWCTINRMFHEVDFTKILTKPTYIEIDSIGAKACSGTQCTI